MTLRCKIDEKSNGGKKCVFLSALQAIQCIAIVLFPCEERFANVSLFSKPLFFSLLCFFSSDGRFAESPSEQIFAATISVLSSHRRRFLRRSPLKKRGLSFVFLLTSKTTLRMLDFSKRPSHQNFKIESSCSEPGISLMRNSI